VIPVATGSHYFIRVVYGAYLTKEAASNAAKQLPPKYLNAFPLNLRSFGDLRSTI
jgi:septal ring-binding cell division protein DamX